MASYHEGSILGHTETAVSPALASAQERLLELRQSLLLSKAQTTGDLDQTPPKNKQFFNAETQRRRENISLQKQVEQLPLHLGWESAGITAVLRQPVTPSSTTVSIPTQTISHKSAKTQRKPREERGAVVKVYPNVAQGILREGHAAAGRVWLLLRYLDENGRGWFTEAEAQSFFTSKNISTEQNNQNTDHGIRNTLSLAPNPHYLFGKRQWCNILKKGTGIFWQRENGRLWLNSVSKTAAALGVWQLTGRPVQLPITTLTGKIGTVRAHLYATFHSSRTVAQSGDLSQQPKPIARETITAQFNISPRTQRSYERKARVKSHKNYAIGKKETSESTKEAAWQHGSAAFSLTDHLGKNGRSGTTYLAWQLPNHYFGPHQQACRGQQKRINRELADLFMKGMTGNDNESVDRKSSLTAEARLEKGFPRRFCANGAAAAKVYNRSQANQDVYWRSTREGVWHVLEKTKD